MSLASIEINYHTRRVIFGSLRTSSAKSLKTEDLELPAHRPVVDCCCLWGTSPRHPQVA
jgi:hypothetical protein